MSNSKEVYKEKSKQTYRGKMELINLKLSATNCFLVENGQRNCKINWRIKWTVACIVSKNSDVILGEIGTGLYIPKSILTNAVDRLEKFNFINRIISKGIEDLMDSY